MRLWQIGTRIIGVLALGVIIVGIVVGTASARQASSSGCTITSHWASAVCIYVDGKGLNVSHIGVTRDKSPKDGYGLICNYQARYAVYNSSGKKIEGDIYSPQHKGCSALRAWFDWYPNKSYPNNSRICTTFSENFWAWSATACETVHS